ncbi:NAD(P)(+)--arginine ADP-ribosyltransferase 2-like [Esox lucius]|uniref:NAD(P)(+)--arginine ADP-ribosyltransferase 2-like n=1 Tax=Esox lucius TaxID=8010 RepID=UPI000577E362|nr:NAD(P)(+)--arginine ADP-ribosyltransferase 2-like [Esox lucius]XP_019899465.1 NAD(P)(+)--arginine ADP-ribosyltransferase 2-like [Esox lucius]XP_028974251.1 NAD(P)(+)--arginine ADP-ribosyltransferase 2-like [Esox lucius]
MWRDTILTVAVLYFFHTWTLGVDSKTVHFSPPGLNPSIPLDMVPDSVDDMYEGCTEPMYTEVEKKYLPREKKNEPFKKAWSSAELCAKNVKDRFKKKTTHFDSAELTHDHIKAICVYTKGYTPIYAEFNEAVRTNKTVYKTTFKFHSLHFLLTDALRLLKLKQPNCHTTYRRSKSAFEGKVNQIIRFGYFASSSLSKEMTHFGRVSCFKITTCSGAFLKSYPVMGDKEQEVLIPPFEMFKIIKKEKPNFLNCNVLYILKSIGRWSDLNCKNV